mgnify:CR=1 FL=1
MQDSKYIPILINIQTSNRAAAYTCHASRGDNFAKTGINKIEGSLTIGTADGEEITNLDGLANLKTNQ